MLQGMLMKNQVQNKELKDIMMEFLSKIPNIETYKGEPLILLGIDSIIKFHSEQINVEILFDVISQLLKSFDDNKLFQNIVLPCMDENNETLIKHCIKFIGNLKLEEIQKKEIFKKILRFNDHRVEHSDEFNSEIVSLIGRYSEEFKQSNLKIKQEFGFASQLKIYSINNSSNSLISANIEENLIILSHLASNSSCIEEYDILVRRFSQGIIEKIENNILNNGFHDSLISSIIQAVPYFLPNELLNYFKFFLIPLSYEHWNRTMFKEEIILNAFTKLMDSSLISQSSIPFSKINFKIFHSKVKMKFPFTFKFTSKILNLIQVNFIELNSLDHHI
jgi:hypothetical protein